MITPERCKGIPRPDIENMFYIFGGDVRGGNYPGMIAATLVVVKQKNLPISAIKCLRCTIHPAEEGRGVSP